MTNEGKVTVVSQFFVP